MSRVFVTGGSGVIGGALVERLVQRGDDVVALARSDAAAAKLAGPRRARSCAATCSTTRRSRAAWTGADLAFHVAGVNKLCVEDPEPMRRVNVDGAVAAVRAAAAGGRAAPRRTRRRRRRSARRRARSAARTRRTAAGTCRPTSARRPRASAPCSPRRGDRPGRRLRQPVVGPGAGPRRRHRALPARLPRRPDEGLRPDQREPGRHRRLRRGPPAGRRARAGRRALPAQRHDADPDRGARARRRGRRRPAQAAAAAAPRGDGRRGRRRGRLSPRAPLAAGVPRDGPHAAARPPLRRLARRARARPALHRPDARRCGAPSTGRARPGCSRTSSRAVSSSLWKTSARRSSICCSRSETSSARKPRKPPSLAALAARWAAVFSHSRNCSRSSGVVFSTSSWLTRAQLGRGPPRPRRCPWA